MHQHRCPFVVRLQHCYASANISVKSNHIQIHFQQELNMEDCEQTIKFLLMPVADWETFDCDYTLAISTPGKQFRIYQLCIKEYVCRINPYTKTGEIPKYPVAS